jgi:hypothetical protein
MKKISFLIIVTLAAFQYNVFAQANTAFIEAVKKDSITLARHWLEMGAYVNAKERFGRSAGFYRTALSEAEEHGYTEILNLLRAHGAKK